MPNPKMHKAGNNINFQTEINTIKTHFLMTENEINALSENTQYLEIFGQ